MALGGVQVEGGLDGAPEHPAAGSEPAHVCCRNRPGGDAQTAPGVRPLAGVRRSGDVEDDDEGAVGPLTEVLRKDRRRAVGVRARNFEGSRKQRLQAFGSPAAGDERAEPEHQHRHPVAEDDASPTLGHVRRLPRRNE